MFAVLYCVDKPGHGAVRAENRPAHVDYLKVHQDKIVTAGPTLGADGESMTGSVIILEVESLAEAEAFAANDPYKQAGLFERVDIKAWKKVL